jgi:mannan endo-1,4-beta-mannosidase
MEEGQEKEIGWYAWSRGPGNRPQTWLNMTRDGTFDTLDDSGEDVALTSPYSIRNTSVKPVSLSGTGEPED